MRVYANDQELFSTFATTQTTPIPQISAHPRREPNRAIASALALSEGWTYLSEVVEIRAWPSMPESIPMSSPPYTQRVAKVCLRS